MLFVPLPLFATICLAVMFVRFVMTRDMTLRAHQLFAGLVGLYAVQSLLVTLRWGYGFEGVAVALILLAPVLPAVAYLAYASLAGVMSGRAFWPLGVIAVNWIAFAALPVLPDPFILMTYLGFGGLLVRLGWRGADGLSLSPIGDAREIGFAILLTGGALVASGMTDVYLIVDFIRNEGRNAGLILTFVQTAFILCIGAAACFGRSTENPTATPEAPAPEAQEGDADIVDRLVTQFSQNGLHRNEDLSLRVLARKLGLPDRRVSQAINRVSGQSVSQFVNEFRIKEACDLLQTTDKTILEVSLTAGFATKSNFNREFSRVTGHTPSAWRKAYATTG